MLFAVLAMPPAVSEAQDQDGDPLPSFAGPAAPQLPVTLARDAEGRATVRAVRLSETLHVDGHLDEAVYQNVEPSSDFIQMEPDGGQPATEKTEIWVFFDQDNIYVTVRAWESQPDRVIANEMRRDNFNMISGNDNVGFAFDTFYDRRSASLFVVTPLAARSDGQSTNERQYFGDWNPVWEVAAVRFEGGWTVEAAIPFKSLRYRPGRAQLWGFSARRTSKWKNETSFLTRIPPSYGMGRGSFAASLYATLVGLEAPPPSKNIELKPYGVADLTTDRNAAPLVSNDPGGQIGGDAKLAVRQSLTADLTVNTDFAQVEADEQQINLTRFSLFFPEKREFFLENQGTFAFGGAGGTMGDSGDTPIMFYSRRIGLGPQGQQVPILAGGRLTGRTGRYTLGVLDIQTRDKPSVFADATNFSVVRVKRDILRRSSIGAIATARSVAQARPGSNQLFGFDGTFAFFDNVAINTYWAKTRSEGLSDDDISYRAQFDYGGDRYGAQLERLAIGDRFNPEIGYVRRDDIRKNYGMFRFSPRPKAIRSVRKFSYIGSMTYIEDGVGRVETKKPDGEFAIEFQNSDRFSVGVNSNRELVKAAFNVSGIVIPAGPYAFTRGRAAYSLGQQRAVSGNVATEFGTFYDGHLTTLTFNRSRVNVSSQLAFEPSVTINWIDLPAGNTTSRLVGSRVVYTMTPMMFVSALVQYNSSSHLVSTNVRMRWEYRPGSEWFVVYNEERDSLGPAYPDLRNRSLIIKINRLFRF